MKKAMIADLCLLFITFVWGATFVLVQNAIAALEPLTFNSVRFFLASVLLILFLSLFFPQQLRAIDRRLLAGGALLGVWLFCGYAFQTVGLLYTTSSKAGFITGLSVVLVPVFTFFILKEKPTGPAIGGALIAAVGLYFLTWGERFSFNKGDVLVFFCAVSFALQIIFTGKYAPRFPALALALVQIMTVSVLSGIFALFLEDWRKAFDWQVIGKPNVLAALLITAVFATAFAFVAQTVLQTFTTAARVALIYAMEPVFAALTAYFWAHEKLGAKALLGCALIFAGMILAELPRSLPFRKKISGKRRKFGNI
ncbi:DMT family transporter [Bacillaceae bacterium]